MKYNQSIADIDNETVKMINELIAMIDAASKQGNFDAWRSLLQTWFRNIYPKIMRLEDSEEILEDINEIVERVNTSQESYNLAIQEGQIVPNMASNLHAILTEFENKLRELFYRCFEG